ncbi:lysine transporter LysE [Corynebacterium sp. CNJ-954]|uniref:LysE family translocator n=1 Tax=Corynebacterium sp. CNJ-954 TaxID=1904962 RepID=UPI0009699BB9|nr:LysE family translocator [Corynebacterium sp. CNJ-954]OLT55247.1 lysine transporter LysE [Corynebacterium sp. CNJ-954]
MIPLEQAVGITLACVVLIAVPGPSVMFVVGRALSYGRTSAMGSVVGNAIGCYSVGALIALGLGPLLERSEILFQIIKWVGILYLVYLGIQAIRHAGPVTTANDVDTDQAAKTPWAAIRTGTIVGLTNPKSFVLFTAIVPQFVNPGAGSTTIQMLVLGIVPMIIGLITDATWALVAGRARTWLAKSPERMTAIGRIGGVSIIGVGMSVAFSGNHR